MTTEVATDGAVVRRELDELGGAALGPLLDPDSCAAVAALDDDPRHFRSSVDMGRHRFGRGRYSYFAYPLPDVVDGLRHALWPRLLPVAREWAERLGQPAPWPDELDDWLALCHGVVMTTEHRPLRTARGWSRAPVRHGVSVVRSGHRRTLGILFHDAA